ncbi:MAG: MOSC domain-containing protein [Candidatus Zixiibacteriota bacterium]|nr:MAG: MOSC domain-containing protein [candidate division Zixibacteria bacterium]
MTANGDRQEQNSAGAATVFRLSVSGSKEQKKTNVRRVTVTNEGIVGDAHSGTARALSLLPYESFEQYGHLGLNIGPGDFGENVTTLGIDFAELTVGSKLALGDSVVIEIIQVGKECHDGCDIKQTVGDCIMPREGLFARVLTEGKVNEGDSIRIVG